MERQLHTVSHQVMDLDVDCNYIYTDVFNLFTEHVIQV